MIQNPFMATLKKYEPVRVESLIFYKILIKHVSHGEMQSFLNDFSKELNLELDRLFLSPVRWKKMTLDSSDYVKKHYKISFTEDDVHFFADLEEIQINRKWIDDSDVFEYSLVFKKEATSDITDRLVTEAYLNYKEENGDGKMQFIEFEITTELQENVQQLDASTDVL